MCRTGTYICSNVAGFRTSEKLFYVHMQFLNCELVSIDADFIHTSRNIEKGLYKNILKKTFPKKEGEKIRAILQIC